MVTTSPVAPTTAKTPRRFEGTVVSDSMQKTRVVLVERLRWHPKYGKSTRVRQRYQVHDPEETAHVGDRVRFEECRPLSKQKRWRLIGVVRPES